MSENAVENVSLQEHGQSTQECRRMVDHALTRNPVVKFMLEKLEEVRNWFDTRRLICTNIIGSFHLLILICACRQVVLWETDSSVWSPVRKQLVVDSGFLTA